MFMELARAIWPARWLRVGSLVAGAAGLFAHTAFLLIQAPNPATPSGSLLLLAWVLAVFFLYGSFHHARIAWGVFVLPLVVGLLLLSVLIADGEFGSIRQPLGVLSTPRSWGIIHGGLLLLAAVGVSVGCVASVMYLIQARRLKTKSHPTAGLRLFSLERLERMSRRALDWAFPLWTAGLLLGAVLMYVNAAQLKDWAALKIAGTAGLWIVFLLLMYLRYGVHLPGRRLAILTILAFILMLLTLAASHDFGQEFGMSGDLE